MDLESSCCGEELAELIEAFLYVDDGAWEWFDGPSDEFAEADPDCDAMSGRFLEFCARRGVDGELVLLEPAGPAPLYDRHWLAVFGGVAVDWTARQFYNVPKDREDWLAWWAIPCPLVFAWPGRYPLPVVEFAESFRSSEWEHLHAAA